MHQIEGNLQAKGLRVLMAASRFNQLVTERLIEGAHKTLLRCGVAEDDITLAQTPGALELPQALLAAANTNRYHALIALGAVIKGETPHFDYVCSTAFAGFNQVSQHSGMALGIGLLTTQTLEQALDRVGGKHGHKGEEAAYCALEMVSVIQGIQNNPAPRTS